MGKSLTTPGDLQQGVLDGLADAAAESGSKSGPAGRRADGSCHHPVEQRGFRLHRRPHRGLTTRGFGDTLIIMRATGRVAGLSVFERHHYRATAKPRLLVDERDIFEIPERVDPAARS